MAHNLASPCLGHEPKARVATGNELVNAPNIDVAQRGEVNE
jgi:hypothetical protein